jgi:hypothetical protein
LRGRKVAVAISSIIKQQKAAIAAFCYGREQSLLLVWPNESVGLAVMEAGAGSSRRYAEVKTACILSCYSCKALDRIVCLTGFDEARFPEPLASLPVLAALAVSE